MQLFSRKETIMSENTVKGQLEGEAREKAMARFFEQLEQWFQTAPLPRVLGFLISELEKPNLYLRKVGRITK